MRLEGYIDWKLPDGSVLRVKLATWVSWPHHVEGSKMMPFCWCDGNVDAKTNTFAARYGVSRKY